MCQVLSEVGGGGRDAPYLPADCVSGPVRGGEGGTLHTCQQIVCQVLTEVGGGRDAPYLPADCVSGPVRGGGEGRPIPASRLCVRSCQRWGGGEGRPIPASRLCVRSCQRWGGGRDAPYLPADCVSGPVRGGEGGGTPHTCQQIVCQVLTEVGRGGGTPHTCQQIVCQVLTEVGGRDAPYLPADCVSGPDRGGGGEGRPIPASRLCVRSCQRWGGGRDAPYLPADCVSGPVRGGGGDAPYLPADSVSGPVRGGGEGRPIPASRLCVRSCQRWGGGTPHTCQQIVCQVLSEVGRGGGGTPHTWQLKDAVLSQRYL